MSATQSLSHITAPISLGELVDKITILQIKTQQIHGKGLENVRQELHVLVTILDDLRFSIDDEIISRLKNVNADLWQIEDDIREKERLKDFGEGFIQLARSVYYHNDRRAAIKRELNVAYGSSLIEEKSYKEY